MQTPTSRRLACSLSLAGLLLAAAGCKHDPWQDGRYWRQPTPPARVRPMSISVGRHGDTATSDVGAGFSLSSDWNETGGASTGRAERTAETTVWRETSVSQADWYDAPRTGTHSEAKVRPAIAGRTVDSREGVESTVQVNVARRIDD